MQQIYRLCEEVHHKGFLTLGCEQEETFYSLTVQLYALYVLHFESLNEKD